MALYDLQTIKDLLKARGVNIIHSDAKDDTSQHEFVHTKIFIIAAKS
jgi:hypothetical protein